MQNLILLIAGFMGGFAVSLTFFVFLISRWAEERYGRQPLIAKPDLPIPVELHIERHVLRDLGLSPIDGPIILAGISCFLVFIARRRNDFEQWQILVAPAALGIVAGAVARCSAKRRENENPSARGWDRAVERRSHLLASERCCVSDDDSILELLQAGEPRSWLRH